MNTVTILTSPLAVAQLLHLANFFLHLQDYFFLNKEAEAIKFKTICVSGLFAIRLNIFVGQKNLVHYLLLHHHECCSWITRDQYAYQLCHLWYKWNDVLTGISIPSFNDNLDVLQAPQLFVRATPKKTLTLVLFTVLVTERPVRIEALQSEDNS